RAGEIDRRRPRRTIDGDRHADDGPAVHLVFEATVGQRTDDTAHRFLGVVLHVLHVGADDRQAEVLDHFFQLVRALRARGDLRAQIGEVLLDIAHRVAAGLKDRAYFR